MITRILFFAYGCFTYVLFLATFLYSIGFIGGFAVPTQLDGPATAPFSIALPSTYCCSACLRSSTVSWRAGGSSAGGRRSCRGRLSAPLTCSSRAWPLTYYSGSGARLVEPYGVSNSRSRVYLSGQSSHMAGCRCL